MQSRLLGTGFGLSVVSSVVLLVFPSGIEIQNGQTVNKTLLEVNGAWTYAVLLIPILISLVPLLFPGRAPLIVTTMLICAFTILTGFYFYAPSAVVMLFTTGTSLAADYGSRPA
jgi:hypothetical protein